MLQPIAESVIAPMFGWLSQTVGEPVPAYPWITLAAVTGALVLAARIVDETSWDSLGLGVVAWRLQYVGVGLGLGTVTLVGTMVLIGVTGHAHVEQLGAGTVDGVFVPTSWEGTAFRLGVLLAPAALWEELVFRGYLWTVARDAAGVQVARWSTAVAFGIVHLMNPGASVHSALAVVVAGYCLGAIREHTNSVMAAFGAHFMWNWMMAAVLHVAVSGVAFQTPVYRVIVSGPAWWSGGSWGPEGGVAALLVLTGALALSNKLQLQSQHKTQIKTQIHNAADEAAG